MKPDRTFIQMIFPLKLDWEPWYSTTEDVFVGQRVAATLSGRQYTAVVSSVGGTPEVDPGKIRPIDFIERDLEPVSENELKFWHFLSDYYLCPIGEVYRLAYPASFSETEKKRAVRCTREEYEMPSRRLSAEDKRVVSEILEAFDTQQPVLLEGTDTIAVEAELIRRCLDMGKDVLRLRPGAVRVSYVAQRELAKAVRGDMPVVVDCGKTGLFLPYAKLGLVIVEREHDESYKQKTNPPLYNVRDAAVTLASLHGANILLTDSHPSLDSLYNVSVGKFIHIVKRESFRSCMPAEVISTEDEFRKNGMDGRFSRRLLSCMSETFSRKGKVLLLQPWKETRELEIEARSHFPEARTRLVVRSLQSALELDDFSKYGLVALVNADFMLSRQDFRADEKTWRAIVSLKSKAVSPIVIQTRDSSHPVFCDDSRMMERLMLERKQFDLPPFSRLVSMEISDTNEARCRKMTCELIRALGGMQHFLPKDKTLADRKRDLLDKVAAFEKQFNYHSHIKMNVDPIS